jgi:hypothetical protein
MQLFSDQMATETAHYKIFIEDPFDDKQNTARSVYSDEHLEKIQRAFNNVRAAFGKASCT